MFLLQCFEGEWCPRYQTSIDCCATARMTRVRVRARVRLDEARVEMENLPRLYCQDLFGRLDQVEQIPSSMLELAIVCRNENLSLHLASTDYSEIY